MLGPQASSPAELASRLAMEKQERDLSLQAKLSVGQRVADETPALPAQTLQFNHSVLQPPLVQ